MYKLGDDFIYRKQILERVRHIPKKNRKKYEMDVLKLVNLTYEDDYEKVQITKN